MGRSQEFIGVRNIEAANAFGEGRHLYNMHLTDTEIVRCRDCKNYWGIIHKTLDMTEAVDHVCMLHREQDGEPMEAYEMGFCAWGERKDA